MSVVGEVASAEAFFRWGALVIEAREGLVRAAVDRHRAGERVDVERHLHARYTLDGDESGVPWPSFQLDGYGTWLWALREHERRHGSELGDLRPAVQLTLEYVAEFWREPTTDWWEEREGLHAATLACCYAGLAAWEHETAAAIRSDPAADPSLARLDASLLACATPFGMVDYGAFASVLADIERELVSPGGGVHRHLDDVYYGGGEWLLLAALLGWHYAELGRLDEAHEKLEWVAAHARSGGELPEQSQDHLLAPEQYAPWVERWGLPASPLLWSHASFLRLATVLGSRRPSSS
jgi:GH15 family glucan-1,4-alpha-glucosidase